MKRNTRWLAATALTTAGLTVFAAGGVSAIDIDTDADADTDVDQDADAHVGVFQKAWSNTGGNVAVNLTGQSNYADQDADSDAEGGDAELFLALFAIGGDGGTAGACNVNRGANSARSANTIRSGNAAAGNGAGVNVVQANRSASGNTATANGGAIEVRPVVDPDGSRSGR